MADDWIGVALIVNALAIAMLAVAAIILGMVLSRLGDTIEALRQRLPPNHAMHVEVPPRPAPKAAPMRRWP